MLLADRFEARRDMKVHHFASKPPAHGARIRSTHRDEKVEELPVGPRRGVDSDERGAHESESSMTASVWQACDTVDTPVLRVLNCAT